MCALGIYPGTDWVDKGWSVRSGIIYSGESKKEVSQKGVANGSISAVLVWSGYRFCAIEMKTFSQRSKKGRSVYNRCVFLNEKGDSSQHGSR